MKNALETLRGVQQSYEQKAEIFRQLAARVGELIAEHKKMGSVADSSIDGPEKHLPELTKREKQIFYRIGSGQSMNLIAKELEIDLKTAQKHREHICKKLNVKGAHEILMYAMKYVSTHPHFNPDEDLPPK